MAFMPRTLLFCAISGAAAGTMTAKAPFLTSPASPSVVGLVHSPCAVAMVRAEARRV